METAGGVDDHNIHVVGLGRLQGVERHGCRVGPEPLFHHRHSGPFSPDVELLDGGGAECVGGPEHHLVAGGLELGGKLSDCGCLAYAVYADHHYHMGMMAFGHGEVFLR